MEKLMIITSYFPPEIGAASNRIYHLANGLKGHYKVSVVTPIPNYPTGKIFKKYKGKFRSKSKENGIEVIRLWLYATISKNKFIRLFAMFSYSVSLIWFFAWNRAPTKIIIQSPPLLVAFTCVCFLKSKKRKLILNVSDLWPSAGFELGALKKGLAYRILKKLEAYNYKNVGLILGQSNEILTHISQITPKQKLFLYRNYPDIRPLQLIEKTRENEKIRLVYAGLLGVAQGILKLCRNLDYKNIELHIYGSGAEEDEIKSFINNHKKLPISFHGRVDRNKLHIELQKYDMAIIPLLNRIYGSVPSKIFEYSKLGLPILYFGGGEGEVIVETNNLGWVAKASDYNDLNKKINSLSSLDFDFDKSKAIQLKAYKAFDFKKQLENLIAIL